MLSIFVNFIVFANYLQKKPFTSQSHSLYTLSKAIVIFMNQSFVKNTI